MSVLAQSTGAQTSIPSGWTSGYLRLWRLLAAASLIVIAVGFTVSPIHRYDWAGVGIMTCLAVAESMMPIVLTENNIVISAVLPIIFAAAGLYGAGAAILVSISSAVVFSGIGMIRMAVSSRGKRPSLRWLIQIAATPVITNGPSALLYVFLESLLFPGHGLERNESPQWSAWISLSVCTALAFTTSYLLNTYLSSRYYGRRWEIIWHNSARWNMTNGLLMCPIAFVMAMLYREHPILGVLFVIFPVVAARASVTYHERTITAYKQGVELLGRIMQESHPYTHGHLNRVAYWAKKIAEDMKLSPESMQFIEDAAILHDIGKVAVDDRVLNKVETLSEDEWEMIRKHPVVGSDIVGRIRYFHKVSDWIRSHHERPDGSGYPDKKSDVEIPIESSIISVVDAYDSMVGGAAKEDKRPYRRTLTTEEAVSELTRHAGTQFDSKVVEVFIDVLKQENILIESGQCDELYNRHDDDSLWDTPLVSAASKGFRLAPGKRNQ